MAGYAFCCPGWIDIPTVLGGDPNSLVRHPLGVRLMQPTEGVGRRWLRLESKPAQICISEIAIHAAGPYAYARDSVRYRPTQHEEESVRFAPLTVAREPGPML
jgi:hypothetical protein